MTRRAGVVAAAALLALVGAGCRSLPSTAAAARALGQVGYERPQVSTRLVAAGGEVVVRVALPQGQGLEAGETDTAAGVVWTTLPFAFDVLDVTVAGAGGQTQHESYTPKVLAGRFGPRFPGLQRRDLEREISAVTAELLAVSALPGVLLAAVVGGLVLGVGRGRRRRGRDRA